MSARVDRWRSRPRNWAIVAAGCAAIVCLVGWPRPTLLALGTVAGAVILLAGARLFLTERREPTLDDLTAQEARDLAEDLGLQLYRARDALAFVAEMCDLADEHRGVRGEPATVTTARVRDWLRGAQCARQAGLVLDPEASGRAPETGRAAPDDDQPRPADQAGDHPDALRTRLADTFGLDPNSTWTALLDRAADVDHIAQQLAPAQAEATRLREELAALHEGEQPYTDESTVPTPAQWIWRWNHATPAERMEHAARAIARTDRLAAVYAVMIHASGRRDLTDADVNARIRTALDGSDAHVVHQTTEQQANSPQQVDESADERGEVVHAIPTTPPLTGPMPATPAPTCGCNLPSTPGIPCGDPAAWHIRWAPGSEDDETFPAGLACDTHMEQLARTATWYERHPAGPDCGTRTATWTPERCTQDEDSTAGSPS